MPEPQTISLVIPPEPSSTPQSLQTQIQQIISQKGPFRHVTEASLLLESHTKAQTTDSAQPNLEDSSQATEDETPQKRTEALWARRNQMLEQLGSVQTALSCAHTGANSLQSCPE
jgi:hypothetical protein